MKALLPLILSLAVAACGRDAGRAEENLSRPERLQKYCEIGLKQAQQQDPTIFSTATLQRGGVEAERAEDDLVLLCPLRGADPANIVVVIDCLQITLGDCTVRRQR